MRRPARGAARRSRSGFGPSGACAVPGSSVAARRARVSAAAGERRDRGGHAVGAVVRSSPGDAVDCSSLRLAWAVSAWPPSPRGAGAQRDRRSAYWLWTGAAEAGEARKLKKKKRKAIRLAAASRCRQERACLSVCGRIPPRSPQQVEDSQATGVTEEEGRREKERNV
ncbi:uncharacterized protein LOC128153985 isoform X2 [Harpia harpyja]|uniref:uncharacterized protein LOC128153985 isoform X2 n=1 Tax=Harpia harpyja TaxID=202280 RepID=UPI0022B21C1F|nr:uncharacterized protein LOC128153985 isoform X2 [Harpia harpyja]